MSLQGQGPSLYQRQTPGLYIQIELQGQSPGIYIYIFNSQDSVLDYICSVFKKKVPVRNTACSAD